jgi:hypothetical protein
VRRVRRLLLVAAAAAVAVGAPLLVLQHRGSSSTEPRSPVVSAAGLVDRSGVRVVRVAVTGDGGLIDLRYQVVDADKAAAVHDEATPPLVIDERTGAALGSLLMGHLHAGPVKVGVTYYLLFENKGWIVRRGGRVTVRLGDARLAHVRVQ